MLFATLYPLLSRLSLKIDIQSAGNDKITLTILPRRRDGAEGKDDPSELRPISLTGTVAELDAEFAKGEAGALGQIVAARKTLSDQIADQIAADKTATEERQKQAALKGVKTKAAAASPIKAKADAAPAATAEPANEPVGDPANPATLW